MNALGEIIYLQVHSLFGARKRGVGDGAPSFPGELNPRKRTMLVMELHGKRFT
jgi:hypothetical protein